MSEREPITAELRGKMDTLGWYDEDGNIVFTTGGTPVSEIACLAINSKTFGELCDAIDAVHAGLERENAELRERLAVLDNRSESMHIGSATVTITDELRKWGRATLADTSLLVRMEAIADRIDAEHEAKVSYWQGASYKDGYDEGFASADDWLAQHEDAMAEHGWVKLPVDADGVPWHLGDVTENGNTVLGLGLDKHGWHFVGTVNDIDPAIHRHHRAPTVEDVLREMHAELDEVTALYVGEAIDSDERDRDEARIFAEYAAKLRLAGSDAE